MDNSYIRDYQVNLLECNFNDDLERLKAIAYGLDYILNGMEYELETADDQYKYNQLTTCYLKLKKIIEEETNESFN